MKHSSILLLLGSALTLSILFSCNKETQTSSSYQNLEDLNRYLRNEGIAPFDPANVQTASIDAVDDREGGIESEVKGCDYTFTALNPCKDEQGNNTGFIYIQWYENGYLKQVLYYVDGFYIYYAGLWYYVTKNDYKRNILPGTILTMYVFREKLEVSGVECVMAGDCPQFSSPCNATDSYKFTLWLEDWCDMKIR